MRANINMASEFTYMPGLVAGVQYSVMDGLIFNDMPSLLSAAPRPLVTLG